MKINEIKNRQNVLFISFSQYTGFSVESYQSIRHFVADCSNVNAKSFHHAIYWDGKEIERIKALELENF